MHQAFTSRWLDAIDAVLSAPFTKEHSEATAYLQTVFIFTENITAFSWEGTLEILLLQFNFPLKNKINLLNSQLK